MKSAPFYTLLIEGNVVPDSERDEVMAEGIPAVEPPHYRYAVYQLSYWRFVSGLAGPAGAKSRVCALLVMARAAG
jgi:hypothetical protein